ncbi:GNAT family N-acetyltransferase [Histidinibacterium aquaticum]|uniref:GNAT family N-acetyltransferase n=1 Tax=Histidinibacterium aquaticum TaxID=2613962 RepID=A0A5J5GPG9_9RHOB|nr:GNAT family N-acetyltransferase [Histidinibacterium aquaticum]KAA9009424.1 GNAT family N-acetyltransferase [Histidinibacterium aquaticum]
MLDVSLLRPHDLTTEHEAAWQAARASDPLYRSPFFSLGFLKAVAANRDDVCIAVISSEGAQSSFLPFHRRGTRGAALAAPISDYQGPIGLLPEAGDLRDLLKQCGLDCYDYDHALADVPELRRHAFSLTRSPLIDLGDGFDAWRAERRQAGSALKTVERKMRRMAKDLGPLTFVANDPSKEAWQTFLSWKRAALAAMNVSFILDRNWARAVIETIRSTNTESFAGLFSTLYAGERLVAAHFGMRSDRAWHWWFPAYDPELSSYSPGLALLFECARHGADLRLAELDLGRGTERYKLEFSNAHRALCEGSIERAWTWCGITRIARRHLHLGISGRTPERFVELNRRAMNRLLRAGKL